MRTFILAIINYDHNGLPLLFPIIWQMANGKAPELYDYCYYLT